MKIGIIGAGKIGGTLGEKLAAEGNSIGLANAHGPRSLEGRARRLGDSVYPMSVDQAARHGDLVIVAIPFGAYATMPREPLRGKIVVDAENYYPERDGHFPELDDDRTTSSELLQAHLPESHVVKAFNAVRWTTLATESRPRGASDRLAVPLAGDDADAKYVVSTLILRIGFDPIDVGDLAQGGRKIQPGSQLYVAHLSAAEMKRRLAA
jgi:predicted dinucleotide-binding enzyme